MKFHENILNPYGIITQIKKKKSQRADYSSSKVVRTTLPCGNTTSYQVKYI